MILEKVDSNLEIQKLHKECGWVNDDILSSVYVLKDKSILSEYMMDDIKTIYSLKRYSNFIDKELSFKTRVNARNNGYCTKGLGLLFDVINNNPSIKEVYILSLCKETKYICEKYNLNCINYSIYVYSNPNFQKKYEDLQEMIYNGYSYEELYNFCNNDDYMIDILNTWYMKYISENRSISRSW